jgi:hypothetical protein
MSRGNRGAASELLASAHLLALGYHVFRVLSPHCPVDLIAWQDDETPQLVEVKSASRVGASISFARPRNDMWGLLVVVGPEGTVSVFENNGQEYEDMVDAVRVAHGLQPVVRWPLHARICLKETT